MEIDDKGFIFWSKEETAVVVATTTQDLKVFKEEIAFRSVSVVETDLQQPMVWRGSSLLKKKRIQVSSVPKWRGTQVVVATTIYDLKEFKGEFVFGSVEEPKEQEGRDLKKSSPSECQF